jgi:hypothetical protein
MMNGIFVVATAQDLMDHTWLIRLLRITGRRIESDLNMQFDALRFGLFGAFIVFFWVALVMISSIKIASVNFPRIADFGYLGNPHRLQV